MLNKITNLILFLVFTFVNSLFVYKYTERVDWINQNLITCCYVAMLLCCYVAMLLISYSIFALYPKRLAFTFKLDQYNLKKLYWLMSFIGFAAIVSIVFTVDKNLLNVDRWSAMEVGINALLNGKYPYTATDHLNGRTSNFPGLFILGIIPYLLGNIGLLQVLNFIFLVYFLQKFLSVKFALVYLFLLLLSPAFWWEIYVASDMMTNLFVIFYVILWVDRHRPEFLSSSPYWAGILISTLVLTRGIVLIPLSMYFTSKFFSINTKAKIKFLVTGVIWGSILIFIVLFKVPDLETLLDFNPLLLQTTQVPTSVILFTLILPFILSFYHNGVKYNYFKFTTFLLLLPITIGFVIKISKFGFISTLLESKFDISYLSLVFPFLIFSIIISQNNFNLANKNSIKVL